MLPIPALGVCACATPEGRRPRASRLPGYCCGDMERRVAASGLLLEGRLALIFRGACGGAVRTRSAARALGSRALARLQTRDPPPSPPHSKPRETRTAWPGPINPGTPPPAPRVPQTAGPGQALNSGPGTLAPELGRRAPARPRLTDSSFLFPPLAPFQLGSGLRRAMPLPDTMFCAQQIHIPPELPDILKQPPRLRSAPSLPDVLQWSAG